MIGPLMLLNVRAQDTVKGNNKAKLVFYRGRFKKKKKPSKT